jgi:ABC transporter with metal-binding/Fe-S-binding domain ATP-binding protein
MNVAVLFSGGKDSVYATYIVKQWGWNITHLITLIPQRKDSWMFHSINIHLAEKIAKLIDMPILIKKTDAEKEEELKDLKKILQGINIDGVVSGAIASEYQRTRIEKVCHELGIKSFTPLWHKNQELILREQINSGFKILITGVFAYGLSENWLGKIIDNEVLLDLVNLKKKYGLNVAGEGGEYETLTINGPIFNDELIIENTKKIWKRDSGVLQINSINE